jgi:hypothetical protein
MTTAKDHLEIIASARASAESMRQLLGTIDRQRKEAVAERDAIFRAPLTPEDKLAVLVDDARYRRDIAAKRLARTLSSGARKLVYQPNWQPDRVGGYVSRVIAPESALNVPGIEEALCLFSPMEGVIEGLQVVVDAMPVEDGAIPNGERAKLLKKADANIAELTAKGAELAEALGLGAYPFPEPEAVPVGASREEQWAVWDALSGRQTMYV